MKHAIQAYAVDDTAWWELRTPIDCRSFTLRPAADIYIRTDPSLAETEDTVPAGAQESWALTAGMVHYARNTVVMYVKAAAGTTTITGKFIE